MIVLRPLIFLVALSALSAMSVVVATTLVGGTVDNPNTPLPGGSTQPECLLSSLAFSDGLYLIGDFNPKVWSYTCSCAAFTAGSTIVTPRAQEDGSSMEVTFNNVKTNFRTMGNAISNNGPNNQAPNSPNFFSDRLYFKTGTNVIIIGVGCNMKATPASCYYQYVITCNNPGTGTSIIGDPQFVGLRGQNYQIHGVSGEVYNIVSDSDLQYNSRFVFLDDGECPVINGRKQKGCFSHPGSYLGELGLKTSAGDRIHLLAGSARDGFSVLTVNGRVVREGETVVLAGDLGTVSKNTTHMASVQVGLWSFVFENSDMYVNQQVRVLDSRGLKSHGLLGQTWRETTYPNSIKYIQGVVDDYVIRERNVFGDSFVYNIFN